MKMNCSEQELFIFNTIEGAAKRMDVRCYVIGGFVRDKLIGRPTKDIDIVW